MPLVAISSPTDPYFLTGDLLALGKPDFTWKVMRRSDQYIVFEDSRWKQAHAVLRDLLGSAPASRSRAGR